MDIEKLIEQLNRYFEGETLPRGTALDAATALSTLQDENEKLKDQLYDGEGVNLVNYWMQQAKIEENGHRNCQAENENLRAELEKVTAERDAAVRQVALISQPNEPLTLEQLREMDGEPVWVEDVKHWALIDIEKGGQWDGVPFAIWAENGTKFTYNVESRGLHCYRRPPEGEEKTR